MKNLLLTLFVMCCSVSAFAQSGNYQGQLCVTVDADPPKCSMQTVTISDDGTNVIFEIPNFTFPGFPLPLTILVNATKDASGNLTLVNMKVSGIPVSQPVLEGTVKDGHCEIMIALTALGHDVFVEFSGDKQ